MRILCLLILILCLNSSIGNCCFTAKPEQIATPEILEKRSQDIYLASAQGRDPSGSINFKISETLKGLKRTNLAIEGNLSLEKDGSDFQAHSSRDFWSKSGGRSQINSSCQIVPTFQLGKTYLIFANSPYHVKSFELILSTENDKWLDKVRFLIKNEKPSRIESK